MAEISLNGGPATKSAPGRPLDRAGEQYFQKLLKNINIMLDYVNENGIVIPDDLRAKIGALFSDTE
jgi:hypothetical protein